MRGRTLERRQIEEPTINLTPLIDVVFVILIMFIVIAPLLEMDRVELADASASPLQSNTSVQETSPISIHVHKDNTIWFQNQKLSSPQLIEALRKARRQYPKARPQLFHDRSATFGTYQTIKNATEAAGFEELDVILKPS